VACPQKLYDDLARARHEITRLSAQCGVCVPTVVAPVPPPAAAPPVAHAASDRGTQPAPGDRQWPSGTSAPPAAASVSKEREERLHELLGYATSHPVRSAGRRLSSDSILGGGRRPSADAAFAEGLLGGAAAAAAAAAAAPSPGPVAHGYGRLAMTWGAGGDTRATPRRPWTPGAGPALRHSLGSRLRALQDGER
jgi:hypothetical protein